MRGRGVFFNRKESKIWKQENTDTFAHQKNPFFEVSHCFSGRHGVEDFTLSRVQPQPLQRVLHRQPPQLQQQTVPTPNPPCSWEPPHEKSSLDLCKEHYCPLKKSYRIYYHLQLLLLTTFCYNMNFLSIELVPIRFSKFALRPSNLQNREKLPYPMVALVLVTYPHLFRTIWWVQWPYISGTAYN